MNPFPLLNGDNHRITSDATPVYNCIAWAAGRDDAWWWPDPYHHAYWPEGVPRQETIDAFVAAYATLGYDRCPSNEPEKGCEKIALYARSGVPTHAARQLPSGRWTSKLGKGSDIEHELGALEGPFYGQVVLYLRRLRVSAPAVPAKKAVRRRRGELEERLRKLGLMR